MSTIGATMALYSVDVSILVLDTAQVLPLALTLARLWCQLDDSTAISNLASLEYYFFLV